jgi:acyl-CoA synthetase (AMP-forming)/AMP-acid ligase II
MDVPGAMRQSVALFADQTAAIAGGRSWTYTEAWARGVRLANGLSELGVHPGDRVASLEDNNLNAVDVMIGCAVLGAVRVPLYARNARESHAHMLERTGARVVFADPVYGPAVVGLEREIDTLEHVIVRDAAYEEWHAGRSGVDPEIPVDPASLALIRHSAGTTGRPHGVGYSHHDWLVTCRNFYYRMPNLESDSVVGHAAPVSHGSGYLFLPAWLHGVPNVLFGPFEARVVLRQMEELHVSHMFAAPSMLAALAAVPGVAARDWSALRAILVGGGPTTDATARAGRRAFGEVLHQIFGQTEAATLAMMTPREWFAELEGSRPLRAAGKLFPFARIEIRNDEGKVQALGEEGEIYAKVEGQLTEFWGEPDLTRNRVVDGWVRTGDIGRIDGNGYLYVLDRAEDMIVSGGFNIWPAELESVIADHAEILDVAVVGIPHERWGETPLAVCHVREGHTIGVEEVVAAVVDRLGSYKKPTVVEFTTDPLPRTVTGKLQRKVLREPYWVGHDRRIGGA